MINVITLKRIFACVVFCILFDFFGATKSYGQNKEKINLIRYDYMHQTGGTSTKYYFKTSSEQDEEYRKVGLYGRRLKKFIENKEVTGEPITYLNRARTRGIIGTSLIIVGAGIVGNAFIGNVFNDKDINLITPMAIGFGIAIPGAFFGKSSNKQIEKSIESFNGEPIIWQNIRRRKRK
ncbi:MAG: hypothetical protein P8P81_01550 [Bacteroidia bacterium]|nr:hypothetical protein [Bacteroidia bacterium]